MKSVSLLNVSFSYLGGDDLFSNLSYSFGADKKMAIVGDNGAGKTTLLKIICGKLHVASGLVKTYGRIAYLNQDLSLLNLNKSVVENIVECAGILPHDAHAIAANFGFRGDASRKLVKFLSGGELLRATLAAVLGDRNYPDLLILDEPTNNLDIKSTNVLESALNQYHGAVLIVSHDEVFIKNLEITRTIKIAPRGRNFVA